MFGRTQRFVGQGNKFLGAGRVLGKMERPDDFIAYGWIILEPKQQEFPFTEWELLQRVAGPYKELQAEPQRDREGLAPSRG